MEDDDATLLLEIRRGSDRAFRTLIGKHQQAVRMFLRRLLPDASEADDLAQETFLAVWLRPHSYQGHARVRSWLLGIAWRKARIAQRAWSRRRRRDDGFQQVSELERPDGAGIEEVLALQQALSELPLEQRASVILCLAHGLSHADAAGALGIPLGTVKSHIARGRVQLGNLLEEKE